MVGKKPGESCLSKLRRKQLRHPFSFIQSDCTLGHPFCLTLRGQKVETSLKKASTSDYSLSETSTQISQASNEHHSEHEFLTQLKSIFF